ncbi:MAG: methyltransferase [Chitinophagaceae bacterium]
MGHLETFLKTGKGIQYHDDLDEREWALYQKGMENIASTISKFITGMDPKLDKPKKMLDIGGSHGLFSLEYVKKYPDMTATILELPLAVDHAEPLLRRNYKGNNIQYKKGDARADYFGIDEYDIIFVGSVMHHFTAEQNTHLCNRIFSALKTKGYLVIQEFLKAEEEVESEMITSIMDLFFSLSSNSGGWTAKDLIQFQHASSLKPLRVKKFASVPGLAQLIAQKI